MKQGNRLLKLRDEGATTFPRARLKVYDDPSLIPVEYERPALSLIPDLDPLAYYTHTAQLRADSKHDVRDTVLALCKLVRASDDMTALIFEPWRNGFWRFSDGTSFPVWQRTPGAKIVHIPKDLAAVLHDWLWYIGMDMREANRLFREALILFGRSRPLAWLMWAGVSGMTGYYIYKRHARRRREIPLYGTVDYFPVLQEHGWPG